MKTLSIIIPVYNEEKTILKLLEKVLKVDLKVRKEIIIVDDGSKDNSRRIIKNYIDEHEYKHENVSFIFYPKKNGGKGSVVRKGIEIATGDLIIIQDADLEYDPEDYKRLIKPILEGKEKVIYGSRFLNKHKPVYKIYFLGNKFLTLLTKILYNSKITDMETCYKLFRSDVIKNINLKANHFDIEPEVTAKILKTKTRIREIPISYKPRTVEEGKKINWKDGVKAIWTLIYWRFKR